MIFALILVAHSWYPHECCEERHCHPVWCDQIEDDGAYWKWFSYEFLKSAARPSPDGGCHVCAGGGNSFCIFLPKVTS